ncbi:MAG TPA: hypothetical protein VFT96_05615 [Gemmatimonadaceae bacterium]|nr:hypothetical protein [Gemmatimonadaceae bacterium]
MSRDRKPMRLGALAALVAVLACGTSDALPPAIPEAQLAVLLTDSAPEAWDSVRYAMLAEVGTPIASPLLHAERFEMRRRSDGAPFDWHWTGRADTIGTSVWSSPISPANYRLAPTAGIEGLGAADLRAGERYDFIVDAGPHHLEASVRIPDPIIVVRQATDGDTIVRWRRVPGAAGYIFGTYYSRSEPVTDTLVRVGPLPAHLDSLDVTIFALDSNLVAMLRDRRMTAAGVRGGRGIAGAYTWTRVRIRRGAAGSP